jgi:hypothetical protein
MKVFSDKIVEKIKTHFLWSVQKKTKNRILHEILLENIVQPDRLHNNLKLGRKDAHCMPDN